MSTTGRFSRSWIDAAVVPLLLVLSAAWWVFGYMVPRTRGIISYDIVNAYYPNVVYALRSVRAGHGLLWKGDGSAFPITFGALAPLAFLARETRRQATFYAIVVVLFTTLALDGPVLRLYLELPGARAFRLPSRFLCVTSFGVYMLIALGVEVMTRKSERWRAYLPLMVVLGALGLWKVAGRIPLAGEYWVIGVLAALAVVAMFPAPPPRPRASSC